MPDATWASTAHGVTRALAQSDPTKYHVFFDDFNSYTAGDWVITTIEAGGGDATEALTDGDGGLLLITTDAGIDDNDFFQWAGGSGSVNEGWTFETGKKLWFKAKFAVSEATDLEFIVGLQNTDTTPLDVSEGVFFQSDDNDTAIDFHVESANSPTSVTNLATLGTGQTVYGFYYDGSATVFYYINDVLMGSSVTTNLPSTELAISFGLQNGDAFVRTMTLDYIFCCKER